MKLQLLATVTCYGYLGAEKRYTRKSSVRFIPYTWFGLALLLFSCIFSSFLTAAARDVSGPNLGSEVPGIVTLI